MAKYWQDEIRFIHDSTVYEDMDCKKVAFIKKAGESIVGSVHDYVDGEWQGDPNTPLGSVIVSGGSPESLRFVYVRKTDVEIVPDTEVGNFDQEALGKIDEPPD